MSSAFSILFIFLRTRLWAFQGFFFSCHFQWLYNFVVLVLQCLKNLGPPKYTEICMEEKTDLRSKQSMPAARLLCICANKSNKDNYSHKLQLSQLCPHYSFSNADCYSPLAEKSVLNNLQSWRDIVPLNHNKTCKSAMRGNWLLTEST